MLASCEVVALEPLPPTTSIASTYKLVEQKLQVHEYFSAISKEEHPKVVEQKQITPRMKGKLFGWL